MENTSYVDDERLHCTSGALTGALGLLVQALLAIIAFSALVVKRFCEPLAERRPWSIWFFDTSKQAIGAAVIHFANVFLSELFHGDPCTWYFISFLLDSTVGLFIICLCLKISRVIFKRNGCNWLIFGQYGNSERCKAWAGQCLVYVSVMMFEKLLMTGLVLFDFWKTVRLWILSPITDPTLELVVVMFIVPFIVNAFIFWVVDNFLKEKQGPSPTSLWKSPDDGDPSGAEVLVTDGRVTSTKRVRLSPFNRSGYSVVRTTNDSDSERLLSVDEDPGFHADLRHDDELADST